MEKIFKIGDRVFDIRYGWGLVNYCNYEIEDWPIEVVFDGIDGLTDEYTFDGRCYITHPKTLSFTEYTLEGFSQERPEELPKKGDIVWGFEVERQRWVIGHFLCKEKYGAYLISASNDDYIYYRVSKLTHTNPYENEN